MKEIIVRVTKMGDTIIETTGFSGNTCMIATDKIKKALGNIKETKNKLEFFEPNETIQNKINQY